MLRLLAIGLVWLGCTFAWVVLGGTLVHRSGASSSALDGEVTALWGPRRAQAPPGAVGTESHVVMEKVTTHDARGRPVVNLEEKTVTTEVPMELLASDLEVKLALEHRQKGLLWFPTYEVEFRGRYRFANHTAERRVASFTFELEPGTVVYDGFEVRDAAGREVETAILGGRALWQAPLAAGEVREYAIRYRSRGVARWQYGKAGEGLAGAAGRARDFHLAMEANVPDVDFPAGSLSPTVQQRDGRGWRGSWSFSSVLTAAPVALELPRKLDPGPFAQKLTFFAPVSLLFFFFVVALLALAAGKPLHPVHFFFLGTAFFAFHLLFAYLIDHLAILPSFALSAAVSVVLVVTYARHFVGWRFALREMAVSQLLYLVLFSATFFWKGYTGLAITAGAIATLFVIMQITGRLDWAAVLRRARPPAAPAGWPPAAAP